MLASCAGLTNKVDGCKAKRSLVQKKATEEKCNGGVIVQYGRVRWSTGGGPKPEGRQCRAHRREEQIPHQRVTGKAGEANFNTAKQQGRETEYDCTCSPRNAAQQEVHLPSPRARTHRKRTVRTQLTKSTHPTLCKEARSEDIHLTKHRPNARATRTHRTQHGIRGTARHHEA